MAISSPWLNFLIWPAAGRILIQGYEKGSGKTCSQPWALHVHSKWILNPQHRNKTCIKWGQENCSAEETNLCLQQPSPPSLSPHQYSLTIPGNLSLGSNYILGAIMSGMTCSQPTFPLLLPSWGTCRAIKSRKGFRNTDHIHANRNGAAWSSESNVCSNRKMDLERTGKYFSRSASLVTVKSGIEDVGGLLLQGLFFKKTYMIVTLLQNEVSRKFRVLKIQNRDSTQPFSSCKLNTSSWQSVPELSYVQFSP